MARESPSVDPPVRTSRRLLFLLAAVTIAASAFAETMPLSQVRKGMKGYGLTVFEGTKLEKFDVEIIGVLSNIGPGQDMILARVDSPMVTRAGVIAGMSGSPIYIDGKVIGALAYGWQFAKEPICGITPIEEMLKISRASTPAGAVAAASPRVSASEFLNALAGAKPEAVFDKIASSFGASQMMSGVAGAKPIAVPLSMSGFAPETVARFGKYLDAMGFVAVPSGATSTSSTQATSKKKNFAPGDPIGAVLLNGDFTVAATGTVTHVDGDRVYAFGHPFLDIGEVNFPMAESEVVAVMPSLASSFKMANTGAVVGALRQDRSTGIMGVVGEKADMIPVALTVDGSGTPQTYHVNIVRHSQLSPLILALAADTVVSNAQRAAGERTVMLDSEIKLKGFETIHLREGWAGAQARQSIPAYLALIAQYLMSNEFRDATIESVKVNLHHDDQLRIAKLLEASVVMPDSGRIAPGDTVKVRTVLKPFRGESFVEMFDVKIPDNQAPGNAYLLVGSGSVVNQIDFSLVPPDPRTLEQVLAVLQRLRPSTDLTVGLYSSDEGAVTSGVYLPNLPPSMHAIVTGDTSNGAQAPVKYRSAEHQAHHLGYIVDGALKIDLEIKPQI
jgi:SpoIVB peptidase S55